MNERVYNTFFIQMFEEHPTTFQYQWSLFQGQEFYMQAVPCQRRYVKRGQKKITMIQALYLTNYRLLFAGPTIPAIFPMETFIRDIVRTKRGELNPMTELFKIDLRTTENMVKQNVETSYIISMNPQHLDQLEKSLNGLMKSEDKSEATLKKHILMSDAILYGIYEKLVMKLKMITQKQFWERHKFILDNRLDQKLQANKIQVYQKANLKNLQQENKKKIEHLINKSECEGYSQQKEISNFDLYNLSSEINQVTKQSIIKEIEEMYLGESSAYESMRITAPQSLSNQGLILVPEPQKMQVEQTEDSKPIVRSPPIRIPVIDDIKFKIQKDEITNLILTSDAGIKQRKKMESQKQDHREKQRMEKQKDLTKKVVEYVGVFYMMMKRKTGYQKDEKIAEMERQIQALKQEVEKNSSLDKSKELLNFVNKALNNYMLHRKNQFFVQK